MFLWSILQRPDTELVRQVYNIQLLFPVKNDWVEQINHDRLQADINLTDEEIKIISKFAFKKIVMTQMDRLTNQYIEENKSSKTSFIQNRKLDEYLKTERLSLSQKRILFSLRYRMVQCADNFKSKYGSDLNCPLGDSHYDSQQEMLACSVITSDSQCRQEIRSIKYEYIYGTLEEQIMAVKVWDKILKIRKSRLIGGRGK